MFPPMCQPLTARWKHGRDVPQIRMQRYRYRYAGVQIQDSCVRRIWGLHSSCFRCRDTVIACHSSANLLPGPKEIPCLPTDSLGEYKYTYTYICPYILSALSLPHLEQPLIKSTFNLFIHKTEGNSFCHKINYTPTRLQTRVLPPASAKL